MSNLPVFPFSKRVADLVNKEKQVDVIYRISWYGGIRYELQCNHKTSAQLAELYSKTTLINCSIK